jgi:hypothetical protein
MQCLRRRGLLGWGAHSCCPKGGVAYGAAQHAPLLAATMSMAADEACRDHDSIADVAIVGGGMVGAAVAALLGKQTRLHMPMLDCVVTYPAYVKKRQQMQRAAACAGQAD